MSHEEHLAVGLLTYVKVHLKKHGMKEEADVFALYASMLRVAKKIKLSSSTIGQY